MIKSIFKSKEVIDIINKSDLIKSYFGVPKELKKIVKLTKNSIHSKYDEGFQARFFSRRKFKDNISPKLLVALSKEGVLKFIENKFGVKFMESFYLEDNPFLSNKLKFSSGTFNPNPNPESTSVDGYIFRSTAGESFSTMRSGAGTTADDSDTAIDLRLTAGVVLNQWTRNTRCPMLFDTSALTGGVYVTAATLKIASNLGGTDVQSFTLNLTFVSSDPTSNTALATGDYAIAKYGTTHLTDDILQSAFTADSYKTFTLNSSGLGNISLTGISKFGLVFAEDIDNNPPSWSVGGDNRLPIYSAEDAGSLDPTLTVTYYPRNILNLPLMGIG